ncbi:MAG: alanine/ornithine racemase family PLP-dependent enzyme [Arachnia propionica]|uniref:alanine/ornithine racemase family PLP-dependent enzyme n=1 Tax=Arachnia propionica TaxID=1750 RepID=UPI0026F78DC5|nr:alanine/ornithine racemase family PLP-dependent enzyme [Arachnia propionica]
MIPGTPRLEVFIDRLAHNARHVVGQCAAQGVQVAAVTKVMQAHPALLTAFADSGAAMIADSRIENLKRVTAAGLGLPTMLLRTPTPHLAPEAVRWADCSLVSSLPAAAALSRAAEASGLRHQVVVMVDLGDLREGVWPERAVAVVTEISRLPHLEVAGLGANLACYGGVIPTREKMEQLIGIRDQCREATGLPLDVISGGNSANLPLVASGELPAQITQLRIGEAIILGRNVLDRSLWPGTRHDTVELVAGVIEVERKPSVPVGRIGQDAFGNTPEFVDHGWRLRAICDIGRQDADPAALTPVDQGIRVLGASSDHLILDVTDAGSRVQVGDEVRFRPDYGGLLALSTSPHVRSLIVHDNT